MMQIEGIINRLHSISAAKPLLDGFRVTTQCIYPSGGLVRVTVRLGQESVIVSDDGETLGEVSAAGIEINNPDRLVKNIIERRGLHIHNGIISSSPVKFEEAHISILQIANVSSEVAATLYDHGGVRRKLDFKILLSNFLAQSFKKQVAEDHIFGASHKAHKFANVISFANGHKFIVDAVSNDPSSINARVVANLDVKSANNPNIEQRIVFNDFDSWSAADLSLLQIGATAVPYSRAHEVISRIAEQTRVAA